MKSLIDKYNIPGPRYTSYPTVPYWAAADFSLEKWKENLRKSFNESNDKEGISIYIHLPFCESLCTFCACHKRITQQHAVELPYINALLKEWELYLQLFGEKPKLKELHLGGGTPTFFSAENLRFLLENILNSVELSPTHEMSFECHPNPTHQEHLETLYNLGFRRLSIGVQDYNAKVQKAINRIQPFENVEKITQSARKIGYTSISHDLIFGLPHQNWKAMEYTIGKTLEIKPDRLAFYSYAHVPWIKGVGQRGYDETDLPTGEEKRALYEKGKVWLQDFGYIEIGMDHFALPHDGLYQALRDKKLHRNFMGYTSGKTQVLVGLGMSAISDSWYAFAQNEKTVEGYIQRIESGELAVSKGHVLSLEDLVMRQHILNLMCKLETSWGEERLFSAEIENILPRLSELQRDGLIKIGENKVEITEKGRKFARNVCMGFDVRMHQKLPDTKVFSMIV